MDASSYSQPEVSWSADKWYKDSWVSQTAAGPSSRPVVSMDTPWLAWAEVVATNNIVEPPMLDVDVSTSVPTLTVFLHVRLEGYSGRQALQSQADVIHNPTMAVALPVTGAACLSEI